MSNTILTVEDEKSISEIVSEYLKAEGLNVLSANDGKAARDIITEETDIDLFILDIMLPKINGLDLLKMIRGKEKYKNTPVIMLTALSDEHSQMLSFDGLADDYVTKPFSPKILVKRVKVFLRRTVGFATGYATGKADGVSSANTVEIGCVSIDLESYEAYENNERVHLTLREFELLKIFMLGQRKAFSRQQLLNEAWGYDFFGDERIVDVHIKNLRKKFKSNIIATVKGVGYKFEISAKE